MKTKLLLIKKHAYNGWQYDNEFLQKVEDLGYEIYLHPTEKDLYTKEELSCEVFASSSAFIRVAVDDFPNLKFVQGLAAGYDHFPLEDFKKRGIQFCNLRGVYGVPISEFVLAGLLNINKKTRIFEIQQQRKEFIRTPDLTELAGKKAAILGTGDIGTQTAKRLKAFDTKTIGFNRHPKAMEHFDEVYHIKEVRDFLPDCDFIILTLPISESTYHLADKDFFDFFKPESIFVNVGRGAVCDESALIGALRNKQISGAVLDVYEKEPLDIKSPLWEMDNVYVYPHTMSGSDNAFTKIKALLFHNLKAYMEQGEFRNLVEPDKKILN